MAGAVLWCAWRMIVPGRMGHATAAAAHLLLVSGQTAGYNRSSGVLQCWQDVV